MNANNNDGLIYKIAAAAVFVIATVLIILVIASSGGGSEDTVPTKNPDTPDTNTAVSDTEALPVSPESTDVLSFPGTSDTHSSGEAVPPDTAETVPDVTTADTPSNTVTSSQVSAPGTNSPEEWADFLAGYPDTVLPVSDDAGQEYIDKLTFLGDSTTYGLRAYRMLTGGRETVQVWTPKNGTITLYQASFIKVLYPETDEELTIKEAAAKKQPEYLVITLGVNGVSSMDEEYFKSEYGNVIKSIAEVSPDTKIICQSIFPVARSYEKLDKINNEIIMRANHWIVEVAHELGVKFVDTYSVLCDEEGWLPEEYHNGDGMHLNSTSFSLELNNLRTHAFTE